MKFKIGNRVRIIANDFNSCNRIGDIGIIKEFTIDTNIQYYRVSVYGRGQCYNYSREDELIKIAILNNNIKIL